MALRQDHLQSLAAMAELVRTEVLVEMGEQSSREEAERLATYARILGDASAISLWLAASPKREEKKEEA